MSLLRFHIDPLLEQLEVQREVVEAHLKRPSRWRGPIRSPVSGWQGKRRRRLVARAFNGLVADEVGGGLGVLTVDDLLRINSDVGGEGAFRSGGARIGEFVIHHRSGSLPDLVAAALERATDGYEPPPLAAARLHMELLLIHGFRDGNGRTSRLASAWILLQAGYRSTLLTAVEQHAAVIPGSYFRSFRLLRTSRPTQYSEWLRTALTHQVEASRYAYLYRERECAMRETLTAAGIPRRLHERTMVDHEAGHRSPTLLGEFPRWADEAHSMLPKVQQRARTQIKRLLAEEASLRHWLPREVTRRSRL